MGNLFEKVSEKQFINDWKKLYENYPQNDDIIKKIYENIELPKRATSGSAGYDFILPFRFDLRLCGTITIPTGIRCKMDENKVLLIAPRSGQGFKYRISVVNTIGVIDSDYYNSSNEGHIMIKLSYDGITNEDFFVTNNVANTKSNDIRLISGSKGRKLQERTVTFEQGKGFAQGILVEYFKTDNTEDNLKVRNGGFGSTSK